MTEEKSLTKTNNTMITENKSINKSTEKGLISPEKISKPEQKPVKKISVGKNDIVEREGSVTTEDGRQLLK
jgi:hypothetical protein